MRDTLSKKLPLAVILLLSVVTLTGCTYFDKAKEVINNSEETQQEEEVTQVMQKTEITVVDQNGQSIVTEAEFTEGENLYEILNKVIYENENLKIEFDSFEMDGETAFFITSINGYNPSADNKFWSFKINGELSQVGISQYLPKADDKVSFELDTIN
ncbi:MAG TPA: DUF4430 domain-containing protein [Candidatus Dojkabacteria bacterium]|nr:DUF4430 domain-containing protein [Candidatus Dojkabacteria bacterium]HRO65710.1 DUF4430 domain-containing protein [Candidatus Dojkabacteria bacterium]HRP51125.1 DUF4430 domain-containing protein [Candidatus Dojkabacteria bacterium]